MGKQLLSRQEAEAFIRAKLIELVRSCVEHGIKIDTLMYDVLDQCDPEGPLSR
jgi:hypothetical protein